MSDKLARAQHTRVAEPALEQPAEAPRRPQRTHVRAADPGSTSEIRVGGRHAGLDRTVIAAAVAQQVVPKPQPRLDPMSAKARLRAAAPGETVNTTYDMKKPEVLACLAANGNVFMDR